MPVAETFTGVQDLPVFTTPAPDTAASHRPRVRASRTSGSRASRAQRLQARSGSRRSARDSMEASSVSHSTTSSSSSSSSHKSDSQAKLADLFIDTKIEMIRMLETDLKLKLDVREVRERFYALIQNFEAFEQQRPEYTVPRVPGSRRQQRLSARHRVPAARASINLEASSVHCPNNTRASSAGHWASMPGSNDTAELTASDYTRSRRVAAEDSALGDVMVTSRVDDISAITQCSNVTYREQCSEIRVDVGGPLSSTLSYPQYSTPEKKKRRAAPVSPIGRVQDVAPTRTPVTHRRRLTYDRPAPTGTARPAPPAPAAALLIRQGSDSDATPVAVRATTRRRASDVSAAVEDPSLEVVTPLPRHQFMESLKALDGRLRRQTAQPDLSNELRSPVGLSETDLADPSSFFDVSVFDMKCSTNATRASLAALSALSASDAASSHEMTSSTDNSSYKESDATASSCSLVSGRAARGKQQEARDQRFYSRQMATLSQYTSGTSTSSCAGAGGMVAPSNSPNAASHDGRRDRSGATSRQHRVSHTKKGAFLGDRPACIGSDVMLAAGIPPRAPRAASDPETTRFSYRAAAAERGARREARLSGVSSGASSTCSSDLSASLTDTSIKESRVSCIGVSVTPPKARQVRRSLSKRIKKLGRRLMKGNASRDKQEAQHSI